ncbi:MAG: response regulator [Gemmatimonadaceae bacterium]
MSDIRALLVDDEPIANAGLRALLQRHADISVIGECSDATGAVAQIEKLAPDVVFLDVQMPEVDGFAIVAELGAPLPIIVFVTAHEEHALEAFDADAIGYLLKPVSEARLDRLVRRLRDQLEGSRAVHREPRPEMTSADLTLTAAASHDAALPAAAPEAHANSYLSRLTVRSGRRWIAIPVCDIEWVAADDYCVNVVVKGRRHLLRASLASLEAKLEPTMFVRVHRSALVNVAQVKEWHSSPIRRLVLVLADGTRLRVSRSRKAKTLALLRAVASA